MYQCMELHYIHIRLSIRAFKKIIKILWEYVCVFVFMYVYQRISPK